jgi:hypothetical protein
MLKSGNGWNLVLLSASIIKRGWEGHAESSEIKLGRGTSYLIIRSCNQNQPTSWLEFILLTFGVRTSHGQPWTHLTHHGPDLGETTTFPHIIFFASLCNSAQFAPGARIKEEHSSWNKKYIFLMDSWALL